MLSESNKSAAAVAHAPNALPDSRSSQPLLIDNDGKLKGYYRCDIATAGPIAARERRYGVAGLP